MESHLEKIKDGLGLRKDGLSHEAFAIVGDARQPDTWKLPHHSRAIFRAMAGKLSLEDTVDRGQMPAAVAALSAEGFWGQRVEAGPEQIVAVARHLAENYRLAKRPLPDTLKALLK